jgi:hypothetical protein
MFGPLRSWRCQLYGGNWSSSAKRKTPNDGSCLFELSIRPPSNSRRGAALGLISGAVELRSSGQTPRNRTQRAMWIRTTGISESIFKRRMISDLIREWRPVGVKKTRQIKNPEYGFDSIRNGKDSRLDGG